MKNRYPAMPSWYIDWTVVEHEDYGCIDTWQSIIPMFQYPKLMAAGTSYVNDRFLVVDGVLLDEIADVGQKMDVYDRRAINSAIENWKALVLSKSLSSDFYHGSSTWNDAWLRMLCADCCWGSSSGTNTPRRMNVRDISFFSFRLSGTEFELECANPIVTRFDSTNHFELDDGSIVASDAHYSSILRMVVEILHRKSLFMTTRGYMGIGNSQIGVRHKVLVLYGAPTPIIPRRKLEGDGNVDAGDVFSVVGSSYIHGIMDSLDQDTAERLRKRSEKIAIVQVEQAALDWSAKSTSNIDSCLGDALAPTRLPLSGDNPRHSLRFPRKLQGSFEGHSWKDWARPRSCRIKVKREFRTIRLHASFTKNTLRGPNGMEVIRGIRTFLRSNQSIGAYWMAQWNMQLTCARPSDHHLENETEGFYPYRRYMVDLSRF
ncbi:hypothetical protein BCR34DRAFT_22346 [Clohesyomyces aquaticus]|uniref:Heterokaryon incompatibility domain-containing protein n=1 Tax=Clohesyomyces aquaticus TaxID=1231657 RepID=A0A1Y2A524_9PLEO|nr:hypothetical protein BCR34DRAFT_22346 [Clohesyomyces aquaticus]